MLRIAASAVLFLLISSAMAQAGVLAEISLDRQTMQIYEDGKLTHTWPVSTARDGYVTPNGSYKPYLLDIDHRSKKYDDAPMPYAVFYSGGYAVHATTATGALGRPASHGCVRLQTANARTFYALVETRGLAATRIVINGQPPVMPRQQIARADMQPMPRGAVRVGDRVYHTRFQPAPTSPWSWLN